MFFRRNTGNSYRSLSMEKGMQEQRAGSLLLDVRSAEEYRSGHLPRSKNLPLQQIKDIYKLTRDKKLPLYVYCRSGARSRRACLALCEYGFENITDLGGIMRYKGAIEK